MLASKATQQFTHVRCCSQQQQTYGLRLLSHMARHAQQHNVVTSKDKHLGATSPPAALIVASCISDSNSKLPACSRVRSRSLRTAAVAQHTTATEPSSHHKRMPVTVISGFLGEQLMQPWYWAESCVPLLLHCILANGSCGSCLGCCCLLQLALKLSPQCCYFDGCCQVLARLPCLITSYRTRRASVWLCL